MKSKVFESILLVGALGLLALILERRFADDSPPIPPRNQDAVPGKAGASDSRRARESQPADPKAVAVVLGVSLWAKLPAGSTPPAVDGFGWPRVTADRLALLGLLRERRFEELDSALDSFYAKFLQDFRYENLVLDAYKTFEVADPALEEPLTAWIEQRPESVNARLSRASFYTAMAWHRRGARYRKDTSEQQFAGMELYFERGKRDIQAALRLNGKHFVAFDLVVDAAGAKGDDEAREQAANQMLQIGPKSFEAHLVQFVAPRWGGSYLESLRLAVEAQKLAGDNPLLKVLQGYVAWDQGRGAAEQEDYTTAIRLYDQALAYGDYWMYLYHRGRAYYWSKSYPKALADFDRALAQRPQSVDTLRFRAMTRYELATVAPRKQIPRLLHQTRDDLQFARALDAGDSDVESWLAFVDKVIRKNCRCP
jgi:tetratricopeptide (TPR) repeat protein